MNSKIEYFIFKLKFYVFNEIEIRVYRLFD